MTDERIKILAEKLVGYSVAAKKNDKVLVEAFDVETPLIEEIIKKLKKQTNNIEDITYRKKNNS